MIKCPWDIGSDCRTILCSRYSLGHVGNYMVLSWLARYESLVHLNDNNYSGSKQFAPFPTLHKHTLPATQYMYIVHVGRRLHDCSKPETSFL